MSFHDVSRGRPSVALDRDSVTLTVRQQPVQALVTSEHKEKTRKSIDPPPVVQLTVDETRISEQRRHWVVSPFMFMNVILVQADEDPVNGAHKTVTGNNLLGQTVSSLHRLKDASNTEGGFFVFGDISCRRNGRYRLQFNLFDFENAEAVFVTSKISDAFHVVTPKEFHGQKESTALSRSFSDQGVRLRLRKEQRALTGTKRAHNSPIRPSSPQPPYQLNNGPHSTRPYGYNASNKRQRSDDYQHGSFYPPQVSGHPLYQYGGSIPSSAYPMGAHAAQNNHMDQSSSYGGLMGHAYSFSNAGQQWQRPASQGEVQGPMGGIDSGQYMHSLQSTAPVPRNQVTPTQQHQQTQQHTPIRTTDDAMAALGGLHTPSSLPDTTHNSSSQQQHQTYGSMGQDGHAQSSSFGSEHSAYTMQPHRDTGDPHGHLEYRGVLPTQYMAQYPSSVDPEPSNPAYHQQTSQERSTARYEPGQFGTAGTATQQYPYPDASNSTHHLSAAAGAAGLDSGILNRGFLPPYTNQQQHAVMEQGGTGYKDPPYPTPHQTSPMQ